MNSGTEQPPNRFLIDGNLKIVFSVTLIAVLGVASITPAFPLMAGVLNLSTGEIGMLITIFTFPGIILTPILGVMADRFGRKKILVPSLILFGFAGGACSLTQNFDILLMLRFIQGIGAASLASLNVTIIGDLYSGQQRSTAMGYNASVLSIGTASYPFIGGALAMLGWYYPFALAFLAIPVGLLVLFSLNNPEPKRKQNLKEYLSSALKSIQNRKVFALFLASIVTFIILYGAFLIYYPFLISHTFGKSALIIGMMMSVMSATSAVTASQLGRLTNIFSESSLLKYSYLLYGVALAIVPFVPNIWWLLLPTIIYGLGHGINIPGIQTLLAGMAPIEHRAAFMSVNGMVLRIGQTLGPILMALIYGLVGMEGVFFAGAALAVCMTLVLGIIFREETDR